jgi:hypothetical protein
MAKKYLFTIAALILLAAYAAGASQVAQARNGQGAASSDRSELLNPTPAAVSAPTSIYLPITMRNLCPDYVDDFSNPGSGWETGEDGTARVEYLNGEYRVLIKQTGMADALAAPTCKRQNYVVEADARWEGNSGASYGLIFGIVGNYEQFYSFEVNTDFQEFGLFRYSNQGWTTIAPITFSSAIQVGLVTNHLKATRRGNEIQLEVNGTNLGSWSDATLQGETGAGVIASAYSDVANADARFDNFMVRDTALAESGARQAASHGAKAGAENGGPNQYLPPDPFRSLSSQGGWR